MKLTQQEILYMSNVVDVANMLSIKSVIIEPGCVRGMNDEHSALLIQSTQVPPMSFNAIGLSRLAEFKSRYDIARSLDAFEVDAQMDAKNEFARALTLKGKGIKIDYRCSSPTTIKCPTALNDVLAYQIQLNSSMIQTILKGQSAMGADTITIVSDSDGASFKLVDVNGDVLMHNFAPTVETVDGDVTSDTFSHTYSIKMFVIVARENANGYIQIGRKGVLMAPINKLNVWIPPRI